MAMDKATKILIITFAIVVVSLLTLYISYNEFSSLQEKEIPYRYKLQEREILVPSHEKREKQIVLKPTDIPVSPSIIKEVVVKVDVEKEKEKEFNDVGIVEYLVQGKSIENSCSSEMINSQTCKITFELIKNRLVSFYPPRELKKRKLIVGVLSAARYKDKRDIVRSTWFTYTGDWTGVFIVAVNHETSQSLKNEIAKESLQYKDLLIVESAEIYNVAGKSVLPFKSSSFLWLAEASGAEWVVKTDDDSYVNIPFMLNTLALEHEPKNIYGGYIFFDQFPHRDATNKWYVSYEDWQDSTYPPFAAGCGYLLTKDIVHAMTKNIHNTKYNPNEDVFIGGLVNSVSNIFPEPLTRLKNIYCLDESGSNLGYRNPSDNSWTQYETVFIKHYVRNKIDMQHFMNLQTSQTKLKYFERVDGKQRILK